MIIVRMDTTCDNNDRKVCKFEKVSFTDSAQGKKCKKYKKKE